MQDSLGDRMKSYEKQLTIDPNLPIIVRLDGKAFHTFTNKKYIISNANEKYFKFEKPFDYFLWVSFHKTVQYLLSVQSIVIGYHQSDEISLLLLKENSNSQIFFNGEKSKLESILTSYTTLYFNEFIRYIVGPTETEMKAFFDARAFNVPTVDEVVNYFYWREKDAVRNSISAVAQKHFSHKQLQNKTSQEKIDMLTNINIDYYAVKEEYRRGSYLRNNTQSLEDLQIPLLSTLTFEEKKKALIENKYLEIYKS